MLVPKVNAVENDDKTKVSVCLTPPRVVLCSYEEVAELAQGDVDERILE